MTTRIKSLTIENPNVFEMTLAKTIGFEEIKAAVSEKYGVRPEDIHFDVDYKTSAYFSIDDDRWALGNVSMSWEEKVSEKGSENASRINH